MNNNDEAFLEKLRVTFRIEAEEHLKSLSDGLLALEKNLTVEERQEKVEQIFREAHSLKGAARSVNQYSIQEICQVLEDVLSQLRLKHLSLNAPLFDVLHATINLLENELSGESNPKKIEEITAQLTHLSNPTQSVTPKDIETPKKEEKLKPILSQEKTIRISLSKLDNLFQEVEELLMVKLTAQQESEGIKNFSSVFSKKEKDLSRFISEAQMDRQSDFQNSEHLKKIVNFLVNLQHGMKSLRIDLNRLLKTSEQNAHFAGSMIDTLLEDMKKSLMQPISTLYETLPRMVRDISRELGKEIELELSGGDIEVDRRILEEIKDPIIHIIRNAIDHGIESPQERTQKNKSTIGKIIINAEESHGGSVEISISDDGQGIDTNKLKEVAIQKQMISQKDAETLSTEDAIKLAFQSGVSTSPIITDISGRGIGLGVVTEKVDKLRGRVNVESQINKGTTFKLNLPLTMATFRGVHITVEGEDFIMPAHNIQKVIRIKEEDIKTVESLETIIVNGHPLSFLRLADLLGIKKREKESHKETNFFALIVKAEEKTMAFAADYIHREHEVLLKNIGSQCPRVKNVMAATIMDWGKVIPILNPIDLIRTGIKGEIFRVHTSAKVENNDVKKTILVVEDSITTRLLIKNILEATGYEVKTAVDGAEAYEFLQTEKVDLLLTDVEMPRMDGFALTEKVREMISLKDIPIVICTARGSREDREKGIELGANAYLDKNSFTQESLVSIMKKLL